MQLLNWEEMDEAQRREALARPRFRTDRHLRSRVRGIVDDVRVRGWTGLCAHSLRFDQREPERIAVAPFAEAARRTLSAEQIEAVALAERNIRTFHEAARPADVDVETMPGVRVRKLWRPVERVGLYVPGGSPPLFSTLLMLAVPARIAGVPEIAVVTPPRQEGGLEPVLALAAELTGIESIWAVGGAQAIAALAFGAGEIAPVAKICGPGNAYVNEAKTYASRCPGGPAIDMPAGPSELMVIADVSADPRLVAADLLSQAEHDASAQVMLVTISTTIAQRVQAEIERQLASLPRAGVARAALEGARMILAPSLEAAADVANAYAPEHLSLAVADPAPLIARVRNAGAVFAGAQAAETFGDYLAGSSHVLPTDGAARSWSGVSVDTFMKAISVQEMDAAAAQRLAAPAAVLARLEGLEAHARAAELRGSRLEVAA
jgi:histidinol dehydrogenase